MNIVTIILIIAVIKYNFAVPLQNGINEEVRKRNMEERKRYLDNRLPESEREGNNEGDRQVYKKEEIRNKDPPIAAYAAFVGGNCATGLMKFGDVCLEIDVD